MDISVQGAPVTFMPVRRAVITSVVKKGTSYIIELRTREFVDPAARGDLESLCTDALPSWTARQDPDGYEIGGYWVNQLDGDLDKSRLPPAKELEAFEATIATLLTFNDFKKPENRFFYHVMGIRELDSSQSSESTFLSLASGQFRLRALKRYQLQLYQYFPDDEQGVARPTHWLGVRSSSKGVAIDGLPLQKADSEYDIKGFAMTGANLSRGTYDAIEIYRTTDPDDSKQASADISLPVYAGPSIGMVAGQILLFGASLALPAVISGLPKEAALTFSDIASWRNLLVFVAALFASTVAILGIKKPF